MTQKSQEVESVSMELIRFTIHALESSVRTYLTDWVDMQQQTLGYDEEMAWDSDGVASRDGNSDTEQSAVTDPRMALEAYPNLEQTDLIDFGDETPCMFRTTTSYPRTKLTWTGQLVALRRMEILTRPNLSKNYCLLHNRLINSKI
jgi:hypothetical protein